MIEIIRGDLFQTDAKIIAHGCNCSGGFGRGIAGIIRAKYPMARDAYMKKYHAEGWELGDMQLVKTKEEIAILNCGTQQRYTGQGKGFCYLDYRGFKEAMEEVFKFAELNVYGTIVAIPRIGAGLAGGDWDRLYDILRSVFEASNFVTLKIYAL